jgi:serine phosphatase RsbU (regulator of sigma subunit)
LPFGLIDSAPVPISLSIKGADGLEKRVDFDRAKVTVGSNPLCDVTVSDPGVDPEQCVLVAREGRIELFDIGESGGVLLNGRPVGHAEVKPGDEIWVGRTVLRVVAEGGAGVSFTEGASTVREELPAAVPAAGLGAPRDERFALLDQVEKLISSIGTGEGIFESILDTLFASVPVRRGFLALRAEGGDLVVKARRSREKGSAANEPIEVSRTLVRRVLESGKAVLTSDAEADENFSAIRSIHRLRIKAAICVPLLVGGRVTGVVYGDNREQPGSLKKDHLSILAALASIAAVAVEKMRLLEEYNQKLRIEQALSIARSIQRNFLPARPASAEGLDVHGHSVMCDETGGDYYDYFDMPDGSLGLVVADVTGHGVGPALLMATARSALRVLVRAEASLERLLFRLNNLLREDVHDGRFITLFLGAVDRKKGLFRNVGAGHTPPVLYRARDGRTDLVRSNGPPLGIVAGAQFVAGADVPVDQGDVLVLTTDGIIEATAPGGDQYGFARLREAVARLAKGTSREVTDGIMADVTAFAGGAGLRDDATLVAVKIL